MFRFCAQLGRLDRAAEVRPTAEANLWFEKMRVMFGPLVKGLWFMFRFCAKLGRLVRAAEMGLAAETNLN